jgi:BCD family chlorophyll transporter-like MFS transporter
MGLWGAAQAIAAGFGGLVGAASADLLRAVTATDANAFGTVFLFEAALFLASALRAWHVVYGTRQTGIGQTDGALVPGE